MDNMTEQIDYTQVFNNVLQQKSNEQNVKTQMIGLVETHLVELEEILNDVVDNEELEDVSVVLDDDVRELTFEYKSKTLEIKFDVEQMKLSIADKIVSFNIDESSINNNSVRLDYKDEVDVIVSKRDDKLVYDLGADERNKAELFTYIIERVAELVAKG